MYGRHDVKMQPHTMSCKHHETSASWKVRYFVLPCSTYAVLAEKPCSHLQACQHAITCRPDQSSHVRRYTSAGCTAWDRANTQARLVCTCSASHEGSFPSGITLPCRLSKLQDQQPSLQFGDARCSPVRSGPSGAVRPRPCSQRAPPLMVMDLKEPLSGGMASGSFESVDKYGLQLSVQWIETLHRSVFAPGVRHVSPDSCMYHTGAANQDQHDATTWRGRSLSEDLSQVTVHWRQWWWAGSKGSF